RPPRDARWRLAVRRVGCPMVSLLLTPEESAMLREVLVSFVSDLSMEIADTDSMDFREQLKKKKVFLTGLIERL
ncbi:MAG: hypothetical protein OEQ13_13525, partial [Acidobacteriota bacterium]|nr:hypothetical protein [Acidobacteriota bacterium]